MPFVKPGQLRLLAIGSPKRLEAYPNVPTFEEATKQHGFQSVVWHGVVGPSDMKQEVVSRLQVEVEKALVSQPMLELLEKNYATATFVGADAFQRELTQEAEQSGKLVRKLGIKPE